MKNDKYIHLPSLILLLLCLYGCNSNSSKTAQNEANTVLEVKRVFINGDSIHYVDIGKGDPVVLVHGALGDYRTWGAQIDTFAKNHRLVAYSRRFAYPNNQNINDSADYSVSAHARDLATFIESLNLGPVHLVGHSFGAVTALLTTMDHPELVRSLTLGEPPIPSIQRSFPAGEQLSKDFADKGAIPASEAFSKNEIEKAISLFLNAVNGDSLYFSRLPQKDRDIMMENVIELKGILFGKNAFPTITCNDLKKINKPVLLLKGDKTPLLLTLVVDKLDSCLSNREKGLLTNTAHGLQFENPSQFNKMVLEFISKH